MTSAAPRPGTIRAALHCLIRGHQPRTAEGIRYQRGHGSWHSTLLCSRCGRELPPER